MNGQTIRKIRAIHNYVGIFFAPAILFFSVSGAFQTLGMHEDRGHGQPMAWVAWMASIHKDQVLPRPHKQDHAPAGADGGRAEGHGKGPPGGPAHPGGPHPDEGFSLLKAFVLAMALGLMTSAALGIAIAFTNPKRRRLNGTLVAAGALVPIALLLLQ